MKSFAASLLISALLLAAFHGASYGEAPLTSAADCLAERLGQNDRRLYVYKDFADGLNHYTQKAWMGSGFGPVPKMIESAPPFKGTSAIACEIDLSKFSWGGYMFINGILPAGSSQPRLDFGIHDVGLDLTGASKLVFYACGENGGEQVSFLMGGLGHEKFRTAPYADSTLTLSTVYITLAKEWRRFEILLDKADLSRIACGFGWVTNGWHNPDTDRIRFYLDEIYYEFEEPALRPMFLQSYASVRPGQRGAEINNFAYLYDQCAAAVALSAAGRHERARQIADAIVYALDSDRHYSDGRLRNAYMSGDPRSFPGWLSVRGRDFARIPGFYDSGTGEWREDYYAVSAGSTGNMAWAILALCEVYQNSGRNPEYLVAAEKIADFLLTLRARNGFTGGFEGWENAPVKTTYLSTEHNADLIAAFMRLYKLTGKIKYKEGSDLAASFVLSMYDPARGCFYTGTTADGVTPNKSVIPLDCQTWTILALGKRFGEAEKVIRFIESNLAVGGGYDFDGDRDGVWYEGTAQAALVHRLAGNEERYREIMKALEAARLPDGSLPAADRNGVTTGFTVSGTEISWEYDKRSHVGATAWLAFAQMGKNPLEN